MYTYYIKVESDEHMLFTNEIAIRYGICSSANVPHTLLISKAIKKILNKKDNSDLVSSIFFKTKTNMKQVYPYAIYSQAIDYIQKNSINNGDGIKHILIDGTTFKYKIL